MNTFPSLVNIYPILLLVFGLIVLGILGYAAAARTNKSTDLAILTMQDAAKSLAEAQKLNTAWSAALVRMTELLDGYVTANGNPGIVAGYLITYCWIPADGRGGCKYGHTLTPLSPDKWLLECLTKPEDGIYIPTQFVALTPEFYQVFADHQHLLPTKV